MRLSIDTIKKLCAEKGCTVQQLLQTAAVSKNALYSLARKKTVLPRSVHAIAESLNVPPSALLSSHSPLEQTGAIIRQTVAILKKHTKADPDTIRHTLILLQEEPIERLRRSLLRGRKFNIHRQGNRVSS
jgi:transcriptional regulator with XRE-family HTH domain